MSNVFINLKGESTELPWSGGRLWLIIGEYGTATFYFNEEHARDRMTRKDKLFKMKLTEWEQLI